jgi:hypothetical protein
MSTRVKDPRGKSRVVKRSVKVGAHNTSIAMEAAFWDGLKRIADAQGTPVNQLVATTVVAPVAPLRSTGLVVPLSCRFCAAITRAVAASAAALPSVAAARAVTARLPSAEMYTLPGA